MREATSRARSAPPQEFAVQLGPVLEQLSVRSPERGHELHHDLGQVALEVAVAAAVVLLLEVLDRAPVSEE